MTDSVPEVRALTDLLDERANPAEVARERPGPSHGQPPPDRRRISASVQSGSDRALAAEGFAAACQAASTRVLYAMLDPAAVAIVDSGSLRLRAESVSGAAAVAEFLITLLGGQPQITLSAHEVNGEPGVVVWRGQQVVGVCGLDTAGTLVRTVWVVINPAKLRHWNRG